MDRYEFTLCNNQLGPLGPTGDADGLERTAGEIYPGTSTMQQMSRGFFNDVLGCVENVIEFRICHGQDIITSGAGVTITARAKPQIVRAFAIFRLGLICLYPPVSPARVRRGNL